MSNFINHSFLCILRIGNLYFIKIVHNITEIPCDKITAIAEPGTPIWKTIIKIRANIMLIKDAIIKKYKGVLLSPRALIILANILYIVVAIRPMMIISTYQKALW